MTIKKLIIGFFAVFLFSLAWVVFKPGVKELNAPTQTETSTETTKTVVESTPVAEPYEGEEPKDVADFKEKGNLVLDDGSWFLVYEEPGAPALQAELVITNNTVCELGESVEGCDLKRVKSGARVDVSGTLERDKLQVTRLQLEYNEK